MTNGQQLAQQWMMHRAVLLEILDKVGDNHLEFRPWSQAMTLGELATHVAVVGDIFVGSVKAAQFTPPSGKPDPQSMADLRTLVKEYTDKNYEEIKSMSDETLNHPFAAERIFTSPTPGKVWLAGMKEHEIHHKGQMFVYARMVGVEDMPSFVKRDI